jgi:hypothetical protein
MADFDAKSKKKSQKETPRLAGNVNEVQHECQRESCCVD